MNYIIRPLPARTQEELDQANESLQRMAPNAIGVTGLTCLAAEMVPSDDSHPSVPIIAMELRGTFLNDHTEGTLAFILQPQVAEALVSAIVGTTAEERPPPPPTLNGRNGLHVPPSNGLILP